MTVFLTVSSYAVTQDTVKRWCMGKLTALQVKSAKPKDKQYKLTDGGGLYLLVMPNGSKYWRYDYRFVKRKTLSLGVYPELSLSEARNLHAEAKQKVKNGIDPTHERKVTRLMKDMSSENTFKAIAEEWFVRQMENKSEGHKARTRRLLEKDLYPSLGHFAIDAIMPIEVLAALRTIETRSVDLAHRALQTCSLIFKYAIVTSRLINDPTQSLSGAIKTAQTVHRAAIVEPVELGALLRAIDEYVGSPIVCAALKLSPILFQRPGEIRHMEWSEINWEDFRWEIPAEKMKMRQPHIVPLPHQAITTLKAIHSLTGNGKYVFPSARGRSRPLSDNGVRVALRSMGFDKEQITPHGFRATARTILDERLRYRVDVIEAQLAHSVKDVNGRAYNRTTFLEERTEMMQAWADYLDKLKGVT
jgi:integrase